MRLPLPRLLDRPVVRWLAAGLIATGTLISTSAQPDHAVQARTVAGTTFAHLAQENGGLGPEMVSLRTRTTRTYGDPDRPGSRTTLFWPGSVNYQDGSGAWQPIDDTLVPSSQPGVAYETRANAYTLSVPSSLGSAPLRLTHGADWVGFQLVGAGSAAGSALSPASVSGATVSYSLPGASLRYTAGNDLVKEEILLQSALSPTTFTFALSTSAGLRPQADGHGGIALADSSGHVRLALAAPFVQDSATPVPARSHAAVGLSLSQSGGSTLLTLRVDPTWLQAPGRVFPAVVDPTMNAMTADSTCTITNGSLAGSSLCTATDMDFGYDGTASQINRDLVHFNIHSDPNIPSNVQIESAEFGLYLFNETTTASVPVGVYNLTRAYTSAVTWTTYDGTNAWTTPGGDYTALPAWTTTVGGTYAWYHWYPTHLVQAWANGTTPDDGLLIRETSETTNNRMEFYSNSYSNSAYWPYLKVTYDDALGGRSYYPTVGWSLTDSMDMGVNLANGNLDVTNQDLSMAGVGLPLTETRNFQSLQYYSTWEAGNAATMSDSAYQSVNIYPDDVTVRMPDGSIAPFFINPDGSYQPPPGIDAHLVKNGDGTYDLTWNQSAEDWHYGPLNGSQGYDFLLSRTDRSGNRLSFGYVLLGNGYTALSTITDTLGQVTHLTYNSAFQMTTMTDPSGRTYQYGYDANGDLTTYTDPNGKITTFGYGAKNYNTGNYLLNQITDPNGNITKITYTSSNAWAGDDRVTQVTRCKDAGCAGTYVWGITYNSGTTVVTDPNGHTTTDAYDVNGRETSVTDQDNHTTRFGWTANNDLSSVQLPSGHTTTYTYSTDGRNNLTQEQLAGGQSVSYAYGNAGFPYLPSSSTDDEGRTTSYGYNGQGLMNLVTDAQNHTTSAVYNSNGTVSSITDANSHTSSYAYQSNGLLKTVTPPSPLGTTQYTYDAKNRVATMTDGKGQVTTYSYDPLDRSTGVGYADATSVGYSYDADGNTLAMTDGSGTTGWTVNALGQVTQTSLPTGQTITYTWDGADNMLTKHDAGGTVTYGYNNEDWLTSVTDPQNLVTAFTYDTDGRLTQTAFPNGVSENRGYDASDQLTRIWATRGSSTLTSFADSYTNPSTTKATTSVYSSTDASGNVTTYTYDTLARLTGAVQKNSGGTQVASYAYAYDPVDNMTSKTVNGTTTAMTYNAADELTASGSQAYTYDLDGNQTGSTSGTSMAYNAKNQTSSMTPFYGTRVAMTYAGEGQTQRTGIGASTLQYDETGMGAGTSSGTTTYFTNTPGGDMLGKRAPNGSGGWNDYYYLHDERGSIVALTDASGTVVDTFSYDPYGNQLTATGSVGNSFGFLGGVMGGGVPTLIQLGERYYDPTIGRFTQQDPLGGGYGYTSGDPINFSDPSGMGWQDIAGRAVEKYGPRVAEWGLSKLAGLSKRLPRNIQSNWFRFEKGPFKHKGQTKVRWHFHFDPFQGSKELMKHHLPWQARGWGGNVASKLKRLWRDLNSGSQNNSDSLDF